MFESCEILVIESKSIERTRVKKVFSTFLEYKVFLSIKYIG